MSEQVFRNARLVLSDEIIRGSLLVRDGRIAAVSPSDSRLGEDCEGDHLLPGLVELHTDHLETHYSPRPGVRWNRLGAIQAHDGQVATSGITTVLDCLRLGSDETGGFGPDEMRLMADAIGAANRNARLRAEHRLHLRCEVSAPDVLEALGRFGNDPAVALVSLMDHAPGQRQFRSMEQYTLYYKTSRGLSDEAFARFVERRLAQSARYAAPHRREIVRRCRERGVPLASHDDATLEHVAEAVADGIAVSEFPTGLEAAQAAHAAGQRVLMGAPNVVRGGSHSGNVSATALLDAGVLDILSSDYVPFSLVEAVFLLAERVGLARAARLATLNPARAIGLSDRGALEVGLRADLIRVVAPAQAGEPPVVRAVWREGRRVA